MRYNSSKLEFDVLCFERDSIGSNMKWQRAWEYKTLFVGSMIILKMDVIIVSS